MKTTTEAIFLQHLYTSSRAQRGYFTIRKSAQLDNRPELVEELERNGLYQLPDQLPYRPDDNPDEVEFEKELGKYPVQFHIYRLKNGTRVYCRSVYRGRDNHSRSERYGNYFAHSLLLGSGDEDLILPCAVYKTCDWKYRLRNEDDEYGNPELNPQISELLLSLDVNPAHWFSQFNFLFSENLHGLKRMQYFSNIIDWMLDDELQEHKIVIADEPEYLLCWIFALTLVFPPRFYRQLNFTTFSAQPSAVNAYIVCTIPDLIDLSDHTSDYRLMRVDRTLEYSLQHHLFTQSLVYLIEKHQSNPVDERELEKDWAHFFGQLKNEKRIGRDLDEAIEYYNATKDWLNFSVEKVFDLCKRYPKRSDEFMREVMGRADVGPRKAIILDKIEAGDFRYPSKIDDFLKKHKGESLTLEEINNYVQILLQQYQYNYNELVNEFLICHQLTPETRHRLQEKALNIVLNYGNLHQYNIERLETFRKLDESYFNNTLGDKYRGIYANFENLNKFKNTRQPTEFLQLLNSLLKRWDMLSNEQEIGLFWKDIQDSAPSGILSTKIWFETCCKTPNLLDEILDNLPSNFHDNSFSLKVKMQFPPKVYLDVWRAYWKRNFDYESINEAFRNSDSKDQRAMLEVFDDPTIVEHVLRKVIYEHENMGFHKNLFEEKFYTFFERYAVLKFGRKFFINQFIKTLEDLGDGYKQDRQRAVASYNILTANSKYNFDWLPERKDVSIFYNFLKKNGKDHFSSNALYTVLQQYDQKFNFEKSSTKQTQQGYTHSQQPFENLLFVDRTKQAELFQQTLQKMKQAGRPEPIRRTMLEIVDSKFSYEDWIMVIRILRNDHVDEMISLDIFNFLDQRNSTAPPTSWLLVHLLIALFIEDNKSYLNYIKSTNLLEKHFTGGDNKWFIYTSFVENTVHIVHGIMPKKVREYFLEDSQKTKKTNWLF